jgi:hypothetical protein
MKNLVFYGDGLLCPPDGYGEAIIELLVTNRPRAVFKSFHSGEENLSLEAALRGAPALIGKAPDLVVLGLGTVDVLHAVSTAESLERLAALIQLLVLKTQARVAVATVCGAFLPLEARPAAHEFNRGLAQLAENRVEIIDLDSAVAAFLEDHRQGAGEKRSLHAHALKLTSTGRVFLSNTAYRLLSLEDVFSG